MAFDDKQVAKQVEKDFVAPATCRCGKQASVALATCVSKNTGEVRTGSASEFCGRDNNNNPNWILQDWWQKTDYRGYCAECYAGIKPAGHRKYPDDQVRFAWKWLIGEMSSEAESEALGKTFKRITLTDAQRDTAIEIVNYEAHRTHQPDAIPDKFKLADIWAN